MLELVLHRGRERSVLRRHPWILSGAVASVSGAGSPGDPVRVLSADKRVLGYGHYSPASQIRVRMLAFGESEPPPDLIERRIFAAVSRRAGDPLLGGTDALRLINAEGDDLPGLVADRFGGVVVAKLTTAGMIVRRDQIAAALKEATGAPSGIERRDDAAAKREGVEASEKILWGKAPLSEIWIEERGRRYLVDVTAGQKTGFYLDQRDARDLAQETAKGRSMLDLYAHSGGFSVAGARGGAREVTLVESSKPALDLARRNLDANAPGVPARLVQGDVHRFLREETATYDLLIVDPPPLAKAKQDVDRAARAYKDALLYALLRANPGALVLAFTCSHHIGADLFRKIVFGASIDARRPLQVLKDLGAPPDHPVSLDHPEGQYLSGLVLRATHADT